MVESMSSFLVLLLKGHCNPCGELEHDEYFCHGESMQNASICEEPFYLSFYLKHMKKN